MAFVRTDFQDGAELGFERSEDALPVGNAAVRHGVGDLGAVPIVIVETPGLAEGRASKEAPIEAGLWAVI